jgi:hypothetical protein
LVDYAINYEYISKVLCENKAKPELQCNGKCHLMKELAKNTENEKSLPTDKKGSTSEKEVLYFAEACAYCKAYKKCLNNMAISPLYLNLYSFLDINSVFKPPALILNNNV